MVIDGAGVHWRWNGGSSEVEWKNYVRWLETKDLVLLYSSPMAWGIVPKRAFDESQLTEFRALLTQNVRSAS